MAEKEQQAYHPPPSNGYGRSDAEAAVDSNELRRKKRQKLALYIVIFIIFQIGVITIFSLTVMKVKTPKFRVRSATFDGTFDVPSNGSSFNLQMNAKLGVKNTNWGPYKYQNTTVSFFYKGQQIGSAAVKKSKASLRSTKKFTVPVELSSGNIATNSDVSSGVLPLTSTATMNGKVTLMLIMKKKKKIQMNCFMDLVVANRTLQNIKCK